MPENFLASTGFAVIRAQDDIADTGFVYRFLTQNCIVDHLHTIAEHSTSAYPSIRPVDIESLEIDLPPLPEQRAIADVLGTLDDKIELNRRMNETLEATARAIFKDWFVDFGPTRAKAEGRPPYLPPNLWNLFPPTLDRSGNPQDWRQTPLTDIVTFTKGRSYRSAELSKSRVALVTLKSFERGGGYRSAGLKPYTGAFKPEQALVAGEVVIALTDVTQMAEVIGTPAIVPEEEDYETLVASLDVGILRPIDRATGKEFLYNLLMTHHFRSHVRAHCTGTTVLHLSKHAIPSYHVRLPNVEVLAAFNHIAEPLALRCRRIRTEAKTLACLRDTLLPKLMSGTIRLREAEKMVEAAV